MSSATMPQNEASELQEGHEFELVLGNKQLLSVFFIVVILLGIFFTMGYVVGRNSAPVDTTRRTETYERQNAPSAMPSSTTRREAAPAVTEAPSQTTSAASEPPAPAQTAAPAKAEAAPPKPIEIPPVTVAQPQAGQTYLQVVAAAKPEAEVLAEILAKRGFRAFVAPGPNDKVFRVLVGPAKDAADVVKLKTDLEAAGVKPFVKKY